LKKSKRAKEQKNKRR